MQAPHTLTQRRPRRLDETTNGHPPGSEDIASSEYPSSSEGEEGEGGGRGSREDDQKESARLHRSTPSQLIEAHERTTEWHLFLNLLLFRTAVALVTSRTVFAPDEHWQSLEVAHRIVFGYGYETWEWRDQRGGAGRDGWGDGPIRSVLYPALFVPLYWTLQKLELDDSILLTTLPSVVQAILAALTDLYTFKLARKLLNERAAWITLIPTLASLYTFHTSTRTLSNSTEAALTIMAFYYWPLSLPEDSDRDLVGEMPLVDVASLQISVGLLALSASLRPSNVLLSLPLVIILALRIAKNIKSAGTALESTFAFLLVGRTFLAVGTATILLLTNFDSLYYGRLTFTPFAFLKRNVLQSISLFYGQSPIHFYLTSALPFVCFTSLPYTVRGLIGSLSTPQIEGFDRLTRRWHGVRGESDPIGLKTTAQVVIVFIAGMSVLGHKEVRFLQPIAPLLHIYEGYALSLLPSLHALCKGGSRREGQEVEVEAAEVRRLAQSDRTTRSLVLQALTRHTSSRHRRQILPPIPRLFSTLTLQRFSQGVREVNHRHGKTALFLLLAHILPIFYLSFHSAGQVAVAEKVGMLSRGGQIDQVAFLMPCHSTPWMSHIHSKALDQADNSWFISCEPPLDGQDIRTYKDESDHFYDDPVAFLVDRFDSNHSFHVWPSHLALFEALLSVEGDGDQTTISTLLQNRGYVVQQSFWNSLFHLDRRRRGRVLLMVRSA